MKKTNGSPWILLVGYEMDAALTKILQKASDNPEYQTLANYLMSRRSMPQMQREFLGDNTLGSFVTPGLFSSGKVPDRGILKVNRNAEYQDPSTVVPTVTHEMTHAAERQLIKQYYEVKAKREKSELETQFMDNFQKIIGSSKPEIATCDIVFLYTTVHTEPVGTVTVIPEATDTGPALIPLLPAAIV